MGWIRFVALLGLTAVLASGGPGALAGDEKEGAAGADARTQVLAQALDLLHLRLEARLGQAEALRKLGHLDDALEAYRSIDALYEQGLERIEGWLKRLEGPVAGGLPLAEDEPEGEIVDEPFEGPAPGSVIGGGGRPFPVLRRPSLARSTKGAIDHALEWLAAHQSPNGSWEAAGFGKWCDQKPALKGPDGAGKVLYDPGVTGLALCAFLAAGHTNRGKHPFAKTVNKGLRYLKFIQDAEGCFGPRTSQHYIYNHATAALAMVEAYGMTGSPIFKGCAQKALDFIALARNPYFAWRYGVKPGDNDTSVTGWMTMALKSAQLINQDATKAGKPAPLVIDEEAFDGVRTWVEKMTDPDYGRVGYIQRGGSPARPQELIDSFPGDKSESMTGVGILLRIFAGEDPRRSEIIKKGAKLCSALPPEWNPTSGRIDMYYWYYATLALFQVGGPDWKVWNAHVKTAIMDNQRKDTTYCMYKGSWDPIGPWGPDGGRVYSTAMMAMCLEVYYSYACAHRVR